MQFKLTTLTSIIALIWTVQLRAQCDLACKSSVEIILSNTTGEYALSLADVLDSIPDNCPSADSLVVVPGSVNCSFAGVATPYAVQHIRTGENLCVGVLEVSDTTAPEVICRQSIDVYLPEDRSFRTMIQQDYVFAVSDNCDRRGIFNFTPRVVDCGDVGRDITFYVTSLDQTDTICSGPIQVFDTTSSAIVCIDTFEVELPSSGFPALVFPPDLVNDFEDNCNRLNNLTLSPIFYNCAMIGDNEYVMSNRVTGDTVCTGIVRLSSSSSPQVECVDSIAIFLPNDGSAAAVDINDLVTQFSATCGTVDALTISPQDSFTCESAGSILNYELFYPGIDSALCSGILEVIDTFSSNAECQENVIVSLPLTYQGFSLSPDIFLKDSTFTCNSIENLEVVPNEVFCFDAGEEMLYAVRYIESGDTLCTGLLSVENSGETAIVCADSVQVTLPASGRAYQLDWRDVVRDFSDNCLSLFDLEVSPGLLDCDDAGSFVNYAVTTTNSSAVLCTGVVEVIDDTPLEVDCHDIVTVDISPSGFPAMLFPSAVINSVNDNCTRRTDFRTTPIFYFCPDSSATFTLRLRSTNEIICTGTVIVNGEPSPFGNCAADGFTAGELSSANPASQAELSSREMRLFPNPTNDNTIQMVLPSNLDNQNVYYQIFNLMGQQQASGKLEYNYSSMQIPLNDISSGTYIMVTQLENGQRFTQRFVKTNR